MQCNIIK